MITCVMLTPTGRARIVLRRYQGDLPCPSHGYHNASVAIGEAPVQQDAHGIFARLTTPPDDPRWPVSCDCGYVFADDDPRQTNQAPLYAGPDGREYTLALGDAPPGAMWDTPWLTDSWHGPDGRCLTLVLPTGEHWVIDGPSTSGPGWERTGEPPRITARPSILTKRYHGWLTDGVLSDDIDGRIPA